MSEDAPEYRTSQNAGRGEAYSSGKTARSDSFFGSRRWTLTDLVLLVGCGIATVLIFLHLRDLRNDVNAITIFAIVLTRVIAIWKSTPGGEVSK